MFRTNLKIVIRAILRQKNASVTNIAGLALVTSGGLALKAAFADPVESLRYE